ncbi:restriction endonuclease [Coraliomargarita sp. SDUM461003]|uniref:Restriction endonuclease n=1 Tax=Thalassobacterium maritimum TaxID=3041265 RepID=A0ABU1AVX6_9BACT|nr:restriction endonuclease [Coraliomargarita sp. SDUM461003]MDQ8208236.1 restriction endonuclease [Coraliomargarita sp. SDUM461003]
MIYLQAKRFTEQKVGRPGVQKFVGALAGQQANKGVFMATSGFSRDAIEFAANVQQKVILINGPCLADQTIEHNLGVYTKHTYEVKEIDSDYFEDRGMSRKDYYEIQLSTYHFEHPVRS